MTSQEFKTSAEKETFVHYWDKDEAIRYVFYKAMSYRWEDGETADPIRQDIKFFVNKEEAITYANGLSLEIGFNSVVDKLFISESDLEDFESDFEGFDLPDLPAEVDDTIYWGEKNEGEDLEGSIIVVWNWEKYVGYAHNFERLRFAERGETDNSINTGNLERTWRSNQSVLLSANKVEGLEGEELLEAVNEALSDGIWKWNRFKKNQTNAKIMTNLDITIDEEDEIYSNENQNPYQPELNKLGDKGLKMKITDMNGATNWMNVNVASAQAVVSWLTEKYLKPEPCVNARDMRFHIEGEDGDMNHSILNLINLNDLECEQVADILNLNVGEFITLGMTDKITRVK